MQGRCGQARSAAKIPITLTHFETMCNRLKSMTQLHVIIMAGGKSSRFKTSSSKVLYPICGRPALHYLLDAIKPLKPLSTVLVVPPAHRQEFATSCASSKCKIVVQQTPLGSGDAVRVGLKALPKTGRVLILSGDVPLLSTATLKKLVDAAMQSNVACGGLLSMVLPQGGPYGRVIKSASHARKVVEVKDCSDDERDITEVNAGVYCVDVAWLRTAVAHLGRHNVQKEYYLTDIVEQAADDDRPFVVVPTDNPSELLGMNTRAEAAQINKIKRLQIAARHMDAGVDLVDPENVYIDDMVKIDTGSHLGPGVCVMGNTRIGANVFIHAYSVLQDAVVGNGAVIGPFGRLRPGAELSDNVHIGNFVEIKKSKLGKGAKANHLTYIGDADIGAGTNVGCGTITCNYDGAQKHRTKIGKNVFVGSDVAFVAPVVVKDGATIGAGSVITHTVPANALAVARGRQVNIKNWKRKKK